MTKEERKEILKKYRLSRKLRTTKRDKDLHFYRRDFYIGERYNIFVRNSQIYEDGYECIIQCKRTKRAIQRYEDTCLNDVFMTVAAWINTKHKHAHTYGARIDNHWDEFE